MLLASTGGLPPLAMVTLTGCLAAAWTNSAAGRACNPTLEPTTTRRSGIDCLPSPPSPMRLAPAYPRTRNLSGGGPVATLAQLSAKMSRGRKADTTKLGTSTTSLTFRSTATLQMAYACCRDQPPCRTRWSIMLSRALRAARVRSSGRFSPSRVTDSPVVAKNRRGEALVDGEADVQGRPHLHGGATGLAVPLGEVGVARREQPALHVHRDVQAGARSELLDVDVARGLPGRDRPQGLARDGLVRRHGVGGVGREHEAAPIERRLLACGGGLQQAAVRRQADRAHERRAREAHTR